nr:hypothetical protein [Tanacetum cinerariifolium]
MSAYLYLPYWPCIIYLYKLSFARCKQSCFIIEDQPLPTDTSLTALLPGYIDNSKPDEDDEDPEEDPVDYPANGGDNDDNESSDDDDDDDDVEKDGEVDEEEENLAPVNPYVVPIVDLETMTTVNQGMSVEEIERVVA